VLTALLIKSGMYHRHMC